MLRVAACESPQPPFTAPTKPSRISHQPESYAQLSVCVIIACVWLLPCCTRGPTIRLDNTTDEPGVDGLTVPLSLYQLQNGVCYLTGREVRFSKHAEFSILITALFL